mgnify:CR=1 FL=1|jgi:hypothetical protein
MLSLSKHPLAFILSHELIASHNFSNPLNF